MNVDKVLKFLFEQEERRPVEIYVDMDGVLADFEGSIYTDSTIQQAQKQLADLQNQLPEFQGKTFDELKSMLAGYQQIPSHKALKKALWDVNKQVYKISGQEGFFLELNEMPGARRMLETIIDLTGKLPHILTAPVRSEYCQPEKEQWMIDHFDGLYDQFYCQPDKETYATPDSLLIDDRAKNINAFRNAGGQVILHRDAETTIEKLKQLYR